MRRVLISASVAALLSGVVLSQVTYITGAAASQTGTDAAFDVTGPAVPANGVQIYDLAINSDSVTASLSGSGWTQIVDSGSTAEPNRLRRFVRAGPQASGTITVTLSSGVAALGFCYGMSGVVDVNANTISGSIDNPSAPSLTTIALSMVSVAIGTSTYPRHINTAPAGSTVASDQWKYTAGGGISLGVVYEAQGATTASIGQFLMWDPDAAAAGAELYRQLATGFDPN